MKLIVTSLPSGTLFDGSVQITTVPYQLTDTTVHYVPPPNRHGVLSSYYYSNFTYVAYDGDSYSTIPGTVTLNVRPVEDLPIATNVSVDMDRNPNLLINLECDDIDTAAWSLLVKIIKFPGIGTLHVHDSSTNGPGNPISGLIDDEKRRVWFIPPREFIGRTEFQYECLDNTGATSNTATAAISVNPIVDCVEEIVFSSEFVSGVMNLYPIDLSNRQANSERINFKIVKYPPKGIFLLGNGTLINEGEAIASNRIWFTSNNTGGADPYGNFTYIAIGPSNTSSVACTTRFKAVCSQSYLNVFNNNSGRICEPCAPGAVCSVNGLFTPYADRGFWRSSHDNTYLPCFPESACPGMANQICSTGRTGIRKL
ncbi:hypothetical protein BKA69DRAFT_943077 [Paraphysoderma sedebokerense]|nr:hypothetical protein BKA69DRAFT_943077 [Paraphysoderma sedebokerense]